MFSDSIDKFLDQSFDTWNDDLEAMRELILANLVLISQIPAKTYQEHDRAIFALNRLIECGVNEPSIDEAGNVIGIIPGRSSKRKIVVSAHIDTLFDHKIDHNVSITKTQATGVGVADNSLGATVLISLPDILQRLGLEFDSDIVLLGTVASKEKGDLSGIRHYVKNNEHNIDFVVNLEGITLGMVDHSALSRVRCDVNCIFDVRSGSSWRSLGTNSAIMMLSDVMDSLLSIPLPNKPKTILNIGMVKGGRSYSRICQKASLHLEVRSEDDNITNGIIREIQDSCADIASKYGVEIGLNFFSRHHAAGIKYSHPMVRTCSRICKKLGVKTSMGPSNSEIAVPLSYNIPSVTVGITTGQEDSTDETSYIDLQPIPKGLQQALMLISCIDKGFCDDEYK